MEKNTQKVIKRSLEGEIVSSRMDKTVVVKVVRFKSHPKYKKQYKVSTNYKAHDETNQYKTGDVVIIEACRPISRDKRWRLIKKVK